MTSTIIIDHGSGFLKAGLSGWNEPQMVLPSIVNYKPCRENPGPSYARRRVGLGIDHQHPDTFSYPVERGRIFNWEGVEHLWAFVLQKQRWGKDDYPVLVTQSPLSTSSERQKTLEIMFELLDAPSVLLANQMEMALYSSGLLSGLVMDSGFGLTRAQPFYLGCPPPCSGKTLEFAGQDLSTYLFKSLFKQASDQHNLFQMDMVTAVQMGKCSVPPSLEETMEHCPCLASCSEESNTYHLPDGTAMELTPMQMMAPEMFFNPHAFDMPGPSISQMVLESIGACEGSSHSMILSNILACGGNTLYPGFATRLFKELRSGYNGPGHISVWVNNNRRFSVWLGASIVAQLSTYKSQWMTKMEYTESMRV